MKYQVITKDGRAKRAQMETVHGTIQTPVFMNVGTVGAIKGAVSTDDLREQKFPFRFLSLRLKVWEIPSGPCSLRLFWFSQ